MEERLSQLREKVARLETQLDDLRKDVTDLYEQYQGGHNVTYEHSIRGRLHKIEGTLGGIVLRRSFGLGMLKGWQAGALVLCGLATAAAAWYAALHH